MENQILLSLAPFQGITDVAFRNVYMKHFVGIDKLYTPFFTGIQKDHAKNLQTEEIDPNCNNVNILTPQILSTDAEEILRFASQCKDLGYQEINLNLGCPFPRVANKKRGCGLLPYPEKVEELFSRVFAEIELKFSVKCRLGYFSQDEIIPLIEVFNQFPLSELIIHPRIGKQLYNGNADVERFRDLMPKIKAPLVYNGDIVSLDSFKLIQETIQPVDCFMLGRGLLANPFLPETIKGLQFGNKKERLHLFAIAIFEERLHYAGGNPKVLGRMKELWSYMMNSFEEPQHVWRKIKKLNDLKEYENAVEDVFQNIELSI
jgi:tRNA-dihydrouridine synthase